MKETFSISQAEALIELISISNDSNLYCIPLSDGVGYRKEVKKLSSRLNFYYALQGLLKARPSFVPINWLYELGASTAFTTHNSLDELLDKIRKDKDGK